MKPPRLRVAVSSLLMVGGDGESHHSGLTRSSFVLELFFRHLHLSVVQARHLRDSSLGGGVFLDQILFRRAAQEVLMPDSVGRRGFVDP
jgi:hypothetical protein